ncbi:DNA-binding transcriptional regulator, ArsR family [Formosa sp. Hel1_31_208]|uniref:ArsR/SmtB family transcription factor n=1 Tax=Formosa sp. Hel1_31_208 TaxID=1798225 RepID=UPI00087C123A|nr:metalloregulator ArsR/SmtB family transcription factor [Formosa sp. Hel1_31_208]SDR69330.1 DNA-binding transcriptional regulator, ArsR family [Formosa sp. Hel1_31_208]
MGVTKQFIFPDNINEIAMLAKVFAHPARLAILKYISEQDGCICNDLVDEIGLSQATISQHLSVIGDSGLLKGTFEGKKKCYCINVERFSEIQLLLNSFLNNTKSNCC